MSNYRVEGDLADQDPAGFEVQLDLDESPYSMVEFDRYVSGVLKDAVLYVLV